MTQSLAQRAESLAAAMAKLGLEERIRLVEREVRGRLVFTTSFGIEDQVLTHAVGMAKGAPKARIEIAVSSALADKVVEVIEATARTGRIGDGKIFVMPLERAVRIRTGETDDEAL